MTIRRSNNNHISIRPPDSWRICSISVDEVELEPPPMGRLPRDPLSQAPGAPGVSDPQVSPAVAAIMSATSPGVGTYSGSGSTTQREGQHGRSGRCSAKQCAKQGTCRAARTVDCIRQHLHSSRFLWRGYGSRGRYGAFQDGHGGRATKSRCTRGRR